MLTVAGMLVLPRMVSSIAGVLFHFLGLVLKAECSVFCFSFRYKTEWKVNVHVCVWVNYCMKKIVIKAHGLRTFFPCELLRKSMCVLCNANNSCWDPPCRYCKLLSARLWWLCTDVLLLRVVSGLRFRHAQLMCAFFSKHMDVVSRETCRLVRLLIKFIPAQSLLTLPQILLMLCISSWSELVSQMQFSDANRRHMILFSIA